eukprot:gene38429-50456_t
MAFDILIQNTLSKVSDFRDSMFLMALENPMTPSNFPFPVFTNSPSYTSSDIPLPWPRAFQKATEHYNQFYNDNNASSSSTSTTSATASSTSNQDDNFYRRNDPNNNAFWKSLKNMAVFRGTMQHVRSNIYFLANLRPDLLQVSWTHLDCCEYLVKPLNPDSDEIPQKYNKEMNIFPVTNITVTNSLRPDIKHLTKFGYLNSVTVFHGKQSKGQNGFKYLVVLKGRANADRLEGFLAHAGCVVLIQFTDQVYHFSSRLIPWVHYVPLASNVADIIEKIEWLRANDHLARQI